MSIFPLKFEHPDRQYIYGLGPNALPEIGLTHVGYDPYQGLVFCTCRGESFEVTMGKPPMEVGRDDLLAAAEIRKPYEQVNFRELARKRKREAEMKAAVELAEREGEAAAEKAAKGGVDGRRP